MRRMSRFLAQALLHHQAQAHLHLQAQAHLQLHLHHMSVVLQKLATAAQA